MLPDGDRESPMANGEPVISVSAPALVLIVNTDMSAEPAFVTNTNAPEGSTAAASDCSRDWRTAIREHPAALRSSFVVFSKALRRTKITGTLTYF